MGAESIWEFLCILCFNFVVNVKLPFKKNIKKAKFPNLSLPPMSRYLSKVKSKGQISAETFGVQQ